MRQELWWMVVIFAATLPAALSGCTKTTLDKVAVSGEVSYNGQPLKNGQIRFVPIDGTRGPVSGGVIQDGHYVAEGKGGVPLGHHRVEIRSYRPVGDRGAGLGGEEGGASVQFLPAKYNGQSMLTATVTSDSAGSPINFDLEGP